MNAVAAVSTHTRLFDSLQLLGRWWLSELSFLVPTEEKQDQSLKDSTIILDHAAGSVMARLVDEESELALLPITLAELGNGDLNSALASIRTESTKTIVRLSEDDAMATRLTLPRATEQDLRSVLGFEMDRHTPFSADQVYFDYDIVDRSTESITLDLVVVPRAVIDPLLHALRLSGIEVDGVSTHDSSLVRVTLLPTAALRDRGRATGDSVITVWRVVAILSLFAFFLPAASLTFYNAKLQSDLDELSAQSADLLTGRQKLVDLLVPSQYFVSLRDATPRAIEILDELSKLLPDNTWVSNFRMEANRVNLVGESADAASLIGLLEGSKYLSDSRFTSPVTRNVTTGKDRYSLEALIAGAPSDD